MIDAMVADRAKSASYVAVIVKLTPSAGASARGAKLRRHFEREYPIDAFAEGERGLANALQSPRHFRNLGVILGVATPDGTQALDDDEAVDGVYLAADIELVQPVAARRARPDAAEYTWGLKQLGIEQVWDEGYRGAGVRIAHLDTGVDSTHPALKDRIADFVEINSQGDEVEGDEAWDSELHGTHTAGTICGGKWRGRAIGVAPEAELCSAMVIEGGQVLIRVLAGLEWSLSRGVRVVSASLGFRGFNVFFRTIITDLRSQQILPIFAIGNEGASTSRSPGNYAATLSVGAVDRRRRVAKFSGNVATGGPEPIGPSVVAPGVSVISSVPGPRLRSMDGTSMATPHVAGVAALLLSAKPTATVDQLESALIETARPADGKAARYGAGVVQPMAALEHLLS